MQVVLWAAYCDESIIDRNGFVLGLGFMGLATMIEKGNFIGPGDGMYPGCFPNGSIARLVLDIVFPQHTGALHIRAAEMGRR